MTIDILVLHNRLASLVETESTLVLSTFNKSSEIPWSAVVYFFYKDGLFYFLSSPKSRHIKQGLDASTSATVFSKPKFWSNIQGIQMIGTTKKIKSVRVMIEIVTKYFAKFNLDNDLFSSIQKNDIGSKYFFTSLGVRLYGFKPYQVIYSDNHFGFGFKKEIKCSSF